LLGKIRAIQIRYVVFFCGLLVLTRVLELFQYKEESLLARLTTEPWLAWMLTRQSKQKLGSKSVFEIGSSFISDDLTIRPITSPSPKFIAVEYLTN
jgi:hypothetical protein